MSTPDTPCVASGIRTRNAICRLIAFDDWQRSLSCRCAEDGVCGLAWCVELGEVPGAWDQGHFAAPKEQGEATREAWVQVLVALAKREPHRCRERREFRAALGVRDDSLVQIAVEREERSEGARFGGELTVQQRHELLADVLVKDEATDLEVVEPSELPGGLREVFREPGVVGIREQPYGLGGLGGASGWRLKKVLSATMPATL
jgi:hypothetical protein